MEPARQRRFDSIESAAPAADSGWLITLCDLSLLLLCFFILLHVNDRRRRIEPPPPEPAVSEAVETPPADERAPLTIDFALNHAELTTAALPILDQAVAIVKARPELHLDVIGHTDDRPIATTAFPSNWELSAARAASAARYLIAQGVEPERLNVEGYADVRPLDGGRDANRRVEIRFRRVEPNRVVVQE